MKNSTFAGESMPIESNQGKAGSYPYLSCKKGAIRYIFLNEAMEPVCYVPNDCVSWLGQRRVSWLVKKLVLEGKKDSEIKKLVEADYRAYRTKHLRDGVYLGTLKRCLKKSLELERRGANSWPDEVLSVPGHPELIAFAFDITPKNAR